MHNDDEVKGMSHLRIVLVLPTLGGLGGSVRVAMLLANYFASQGHQVHLISRSAYDTISFNLDQSIVCHSLNFTNQRLRTMVQQSYKPLKQLFMAHKFDVVLGIGTYDTLVTLLPARATQTRLVFCDHGALINQYDDKKMRLISWLNMKYSYRTVVLTQRTKHDYEQLLHAPADKVEVIPNWIPTRLIELGAQASYENCESRLLWCGRIAPEKGADHLVEIAAQVMPHHPQWTWDIVGEADQQEVLEQLRELLEQKGLTHQVRLLGRSDCMEEVYPRYAAVTLTSYREGLPLTLLEGLAFKRPLISFDVQTGPAEIIEHGVNGYLVDCYDTQQYAQYLDEFMSDETLRKRMSAQGASRLRHFSEREIAQRWDQLINKVSSDF